MNHLIGIDVGTTRVKAVVYTTDGAVVASAAARTPWHESAFGTEMDVDRLNEVLIDVLATATTNPTANGAAGSTRAASIPVAAIGVTGMGESGVLTADDLCTPLGPIRAWHNLRGDVPALERACGASAFRRSTGLPLDATASLPKILQMRADYPRTASAVRFYSMPEWVARLLGGDPGSEWSLASRTGMLDVVTTDHWPVATDLLGRTLLGTPQTAGTPVGHLQARTAGARLAHLEGAVLSIGGHDHQTAALAAGATGAETLFDSLGTAEAILRITSDQISRDTIESLVLAGFGVGRTVVPDRLSVMGGLSTGMQLERLAASLGANDQAARRALATDARWRAGVDGVVAAAVPLLDAMRRCLGPHERVLVAGGWLHDEAVMDAKRRQLGGLAPAYIDEAGAVGSAYLAGVAAGLLPAPSAIDGPPWPATLQPAGHHGQRQATDHQPATASVAHQSRSSALQSSALQSSALQSSAVQNGAHQ